MSRHNKKHEPVAKIVVAPAKPAISVVPPIAEKPEIPHDVIAQRAFEIWCGEGYPAGRAAENWHQAERELVTAR